MVQVICLTRIAAAVVFFCGIAICSAAPASLTSDISVSLVQTSDEVVPQLDITPEKIANDVIERVVTVTAVEGDKPPTEWTFDAEEPRQVVILERESTPTGAFITILMTTQNNPEPGEDSVLVSGCLLYTSPSPRD